MNMHENGETVQIKPREIEIYNIELTNINIEQKEIKYKVSCSKGTYIRSLCEDIAEKLDTVGYMKELNRLRVGRFNIKDSITIEQLEKQSNNIEKNIITVEQLLKEIPSIKLDKVQLNKFLNGVKIHINKEDGLYNIYEQKYIGTGIIKDRKLKRDVIVN